MNLSVLSVILVFLLTSAAAQAGDLAVNKSLLFIKRNKNSNEVHYDAQAKNCVWSSPAVDSYWRDLQVGPDITTEIQLWEGRAYGFDVHRLSDSEITISLNALPEKKIAARLSRIPEGGCSVSKTIDINGNAAELSSVYVYAEETFLDPLNIVPTGATVHYLYILGYSNGEPVFERIIKTTEGQTLAPSRPDDSLWQSGVAIWGRR